MTKYCVAVDKIEDLAELEGGWSPVDYVAILKKLDVAGAAQPPAPTAAGVGRGRTARRRDLPAHRFGH